MSDAVATDHAMNLAANTDAPERDIARDMVRRGVLVGPVLVAICWAAWGLDGLWSSLLALGIVLVNFLLGAALITWGVKISPGVLFAAVMGGFFIRLALMTAVVLPVRDAGWFEIAPFAITLLVSHLGLLVWELRYVSASLAFPGLAPQKANAA